jgi:hypothetical protein
MIITTMNHTIKGRRDCHCNFNPTSARTSTTRPQYVVRSAAPLRSAMSKPNT